MLVMLGVLGGAMVKPGQADAHDAGGFAGAMEVKLMLMMLWVLRVGKARSS